MAELTEYEKKSLDYLNELYSEYLEACEVSLTDIAHRVHERFMTCVFMFEEVTGKEVWWNGRVVQIAVPDEEE